MTKPSASVLALMQHVELNNAGWLEKTVQQLILAFLFESRGPKDLSQIRDRLAEALERRVDEEYLMRQIAALEATGTVVSLSGGTVQLSENGTRRLEGVQASADANAMAVKEKFVRTIEDRGLRVDPEVTWSAFLNHALLPMIDELGARTYQIISGADVPPEASDFLAKFVEQFPAEMRQGLSEAAVATMDPKDGASRSFILRELNARFALEAAGLRPEVLSQLSMSRGKKLKTSLFVDTNVLFSFLELHANPANEAAQALLKLLDQVRAYVDIKLYVLPTTLDEARARIGLEMDRLRSLVLTPRVANALREGQMSGMAEKYAQEIARGAVRVKAEEFFAPYYEDLLSFCRARGIELYNVDMDAIRAKQGVIDATLARVDFELRRVPWTLCLGVLSESEVQDAFTTTVYTRV